ncbi:hypothetical protein [Xanthomonas euvesicatoria]|uniref:hypothetical protein n=1 Tax=Xanthomonas euvesicatoria TaxID=456327 RepID=UPI001495B9EC|nr:hypothetical protein [Xanthomonas euvesicatoria]
MSMKLTRYEHFESLMISIAAISGWEFCDGSDAIPAELVFNSETYAPGLLRVAEQELETRGLAVSLGLSFQREQDSVLGASVAFNEGDEQSDIEAQMWRLLMAQQVVESLTPVNGAFDLSLLHHVFADQLAPEVG